MVMIELGAVFVVYPHRPGDAAARLANERAGLAEPEAAEAFGAQDVREDCYWPGELLEGCSGGR